uniref:Serpentine receptor class gamma n=1 Tax=Strongyloides stercoralis TaxID=6248 RepID=A0A0K0E2J1_STRER
MIYQNIIFICASIFEIPSLLLLITIQVILILPSMKNKFTSTFYSLLFWNGNIDILSYLVFTIHHRFPNYGIFINLYYNLYLNKVDVRILEFLRSYTIVSQLIGTFFLSLNRFTSLAFPVKHKLLWEKLLPFSLVTKFLLSLILTWPLLCDKMCYILQDSSNVNIGFRAKWFSNNAGWYNSFIFMTVLTFIFLLASLILNLSTLLILLKISKESHKVNVNGNAKNKFNFKRERNFFITVLATFIGQLILGIDNYVSGYFNQTKQYSNFYIMVMVFPIVNDLTIFPSTWVLFFISTSIRKSVFDCCNRKKKSLKIISPSHVQISKRSLLI